MFIVQSYLSLFLSFYCLNYLSHRLISHLSHIQAQCKYKIKRGFNLIERINYGFIHDKS
jgi:hypothetical protein